MAANKKPRKAYKPKRVLINTAHVAIFGATALTPDEIDQIIGPSRKHLLTAVNSGFTNAGFIDLQTAMHAAIAIENSGIVKGLRSEFEAGIEALDAIHDDATHDVSMSECEWTDIVPTPGQIAALESALDMHEFQLQHLSASEFQKIIRRLVNQVKDATNKQRKKNHESASITSGI